MTQRYWKPFGVVLLLGMLIGGSALRQSLLLRQAFERYPPPGDLIEVDDHLLHLDCEGAGSPTVVFEGGLGGTALLWRPLQDALIIHNRVCIYDRAGYGWSEPGPEPRDAEQIASELHSLLLKAGERPPYVLAGHSLGGVLIRVYAATYPDEVAGLVFIDARHEDFFEVMPPEFLKVDEANLRRAQMLTVITPLGITRLLGQMGRLDSFDRYVDGLPAEYREAAFQTMIYNPRHWQTTVRERRAIEESYQQAREGALPVDLPILVLTAEHGFDAWQADAQGEWNNAWMDLQQDLVGLTDDSEWLILEDAGHYVHFEDPAAVSASMLDFLEGLP